jgi:hypothetical protein
MTKRPAINPIVIAARLKTMRMFAYHQHGWRLPNDERGRDYLLAFLSQGMTTNAARLWVPWCSTREFEHIVSEAREVEPHHWSSEYLGQLCRMTDVWREKMKRHHLRPHDVAWSEVQKRVRERKRVIDRRRKDRLKMAKNTDVREASAILAIGTSRSWQCVSSLLRVLEGGRAWHNKRDGAALAKTSLAVMLTRVLDTLQKSGVIESKIETGIRGLPTRFVRVKSDVIEHIARSVDEMVLSATKTTVDSRVFSLSAGDHPDLSPLRTQKKGLSERRCSPVSPSHHRTRVDDGKTFH